jgi:ABC-type multidrug transport system ATPase subunit
MTTTAIEYKHVTKIYVRSHLGRKTSATGLDDVNLKIEKGEIFGILGLNGAGKTTAMKLLFGLLFPTKGEILINGQNVSKNSETKQILGYQPETAYLNPTLTAFETVNFYAKLSKVKKSGQQIFEVLELVGLKENEHKKLADFSKGMLQRTCLAQCLVHEPQILVLDEPVSGLDPLAVHDFRKIIQKLNEQGKTVFLSSHSISEMEKMCHRAAIVAKGSLKKIISRNDWKTSGLEKIFVDTVISQT